MSLPIIEPTRPAPPLHGPRRESLLPPAIIVLVFAMVVIAITGFAYVGGQQQALSAHRSAVEGLWNGLAALQTGDAAVAHVLNGERGAMAGYFRHLEALKSLRAEDARRAARRRAAARPAARGLGRGDDARRRWRHREGARTAGGNGDGRDILGHRRGGARGHGAGHRRGRRGSRSASGSARSPCCCCRCCAGTLAMSGDVLCLPLQRARGRRARSAALRSADTSRVQVARLFEMADVLQSASDYGDANQVLKATASELLPGFSGALYVFNNSRDRLVLSTTLGPARRRRRRPKPSRPTSAGR